MTTDTDLRPDVPRLLRLAAIVLVGLASVAALWFFRDARSRVDGPLVADFGPDAVDLVITAPTEPEAFRDTRIWNLPSQAATVFASSASAPTLRMATPETGALVGLERGGGVVALAMVPPGMQELPAEILVSPRSTAVTLIGLHPDVNVEDAGTNMARMVRAAQHPEFEALAALVDGERPLANWGEVERELVQRIVNDVVSPAVGPAECPSEQLVSGPIRRCGIELVNGSKTAVLIADADGAPCAVVPSASERLTPPGHSALAALIGASEPVPTVPLVEGPFPGRADGSDCGVNPQAFVDDPQWTNTVVAYRIWADEVLPLARLMGSPTTLGDIDVGDATTSLVTSREIAGEGVPSPRERLRVAAGFLQAPGTAPALELLPLPESAIRRVRNLSDMLVGVYE